MLIKELRLQNFQSHEKSVIKFSRFLNVIVGSSRSGKSAILRSIFQVFDHAIKWEHCIRWDTTECSISLIGNKHSITRTKSATENAVTVDGIKESCIGSNVPESVLKILNISDFNIQKQREMFFMIDMKPAHLSKALNSVSGLAMIDTTIKEASQRIRDTQAELRLNLTQQTSTALAITELDFIPDADQELVKIERIQQRVEKAKRRLQSVQDTCKAIAHENAKIKRLFPESALKDIEKAETIIRRRDGYKSKIAHMSSLSRGVMECERTLKNRIQFPVNKAESLIDNIKKNSIAAQKIKECVAYINEHTHTVELLDKIISNNKHRLSSIKVCPTCERPL